VLRRFGELMQRHIEAGQAADVERAASLAHVHQEMNGRDLLRAAVMQRLGVLRIISADVAFDRLPGVERLDPAHVAGWRRSLLV